MSAVQYTDADFAACLLHCGPHTWVSSMRAGNLYAGTVDTSDYRARVYSYFFASFPWPVAEDPPHREWAAFWREYLEWVNKS